MIRLAPVKQVSDDSSPRMGLVVVNPPADGNLIPDTDVCSMRTLVALGNLVLDAVAIS